MKLNDLQDAVGQIDDSLVTEAGRVRGKRKSPLWHKIGAVAAAIALVLTSFIIIQGTRLHKNNNRSDVMALTSPEYPVIHMHPSEDLLSGSKATKRHTIRLIPHGQMIFKDNETSLKVTMTASSH